MHRLFLSLSFSLYFRSRFSLLISGKLYTTNKYKSTKIKITSVEEKHYPSEHVIVWCSTYWDGKYFFCESTFMLLCLRGSIEASLISKKKTTLYLFCLGLLLCQIWLSVDFTASTASIFNLLTLSLDRYWSIISPLQYLGKRTRTRALYLIGLAWGLSILWVIPIFGWHRLVNHGTRYIDVSKEFQENMYTKPAV